MSAPEPPADQATGAASDPTSESADPQKRASRRTPASWAKVAAQRLPSSWVTVTAAALFLAATAAFGGLADAPVAEAAALPQLMAGDTHTNDQFAITFERAVLLNDLSGSGTTPQEGERVLAVVVTMENVTDSPLSTASYAPQTFAVPGLPAQRVDGSKMPTVSVARMDDATTGPYLQPGVPSQLVLTWPVPADRYAAGDEVPLAISDLHWWEPELLFTGNGGQWEDPTPAARVQLTAEDVDAEEAG
ncbi:hypothetical protein [Microbacterium paludicola]|uniref:hypothetical protein n=1 Tax=Microbacterium paludicola TaxID=300019 RepID=UPI0031D23FD3